MVDIRQADLQSFIDQFRQALQALETVDKKQMAPLLAEYNRLCESANRRLHECHILVQRGQYSNAVAESEQEPNLLDLCGLLEIPERDSLAAVAQQMGAKPPPSLKHELAEILQIAYDKSSTVAGNLKRLHTLTLLRAPLPTRLVIMRQLLVQNPNHPFMDPDIRAFERNWFKRAPAFAAEWTKRGKPEIVEEMLKDLTESCYLETPPTALISSLRSQVAKTREARLPMLADQIRQHFQQKSLAALKPLALQWNESVSGLGADDAAKRHGVAAALAWVLHSLDAESSRDNRQSVCARLISLLAQHDSKLAELQSAYQTLHKLRAVDVDMERRYRQRLEGLGRRRAMKLAGCVGGVLLMLGLATYSLLWTSGAVDQTAAVDKLMAELTSLVNANKYELAREKVKSAPASVSSDPKIASLMQAAAEKDANSKALNAALQDLETCPANGNAQPLIEKARQLARTDEVRRRIDDFERKWQRREKQSSQAAKSEFERQVAALRDSAEKLAEKARDGQSFDASSNQLPKLREGLVALREEARRLKFDERELDGVENTTAKIGRWSEVSKTLTQLGTDLRGVAGDASALERIARCLSDTLAPISPDDAWAAQAKLATQSLTNWKNAMLLRDSLQSAPDVGDGLNEIWKDQPPMAILDAASQYTKMTRQRDASIDGTTAAALKRLLSGRDIVDLWSIRRTGETLQYYSPSKPQPADSQWIDVLLNSNGETARLKFTQRLNAKRAAQSEFADGIALLLKDPKETSDWPAALAKHYEKLRDSEDLDPLLKLRLLRKMLDLAVKGSAGFRQLLESSGNYKAIMERSGLIDGDWLDQRLDLSDQRTRAEALLLRSPRLKEIVAEASEYDARLLAQIKRGLLVVGWLSRDANGRVVLAPFVGPEPSPESHLYTVVKETWTEIGVIEAKGMKLKPAADQYLGWPVFAVCTFTTSAP